MKIVFVSICVPVYKNAEFVRRLLESVKIQEYKDFEVILTDDSPSDEIRLLCDAFRNDFQIHYYKNPTSLGTPENWNESVRRANGEWIKIMHDDDWFSSPDSLREFVNVAEKTRSKQFIFSAFTNVFESNDKSEDIYLSKFRAKWLKKDPVTLFTKNVIGPPSVTMIKRSVMIDFDNRLKWLVDIDFYIRVLKKTKTVYIPKSLVNIGINSSQVTRFAFRDPKVEIPESFSILHKTGAPHLRNILVYDSWWRLFRNLSIHDTEAVRANGFEGRIHLVLRRMLDWQKVIPPVLLRIGIISKILVGLHYVIYYRKIRK